MVSLVILDDRLMVLESLASALRRRGHIVLAAASQPAVGVAATLDLRPDVCVVNGGADDALNIVRQLRAKNAGTPVLVLSERTRPRDVEAARTAGADSMVSTSASIEAVSVAVTKLSRGTAVWPDSVSMQQAQPLARGLTPREWQVLELLAAGAPTLDIAAALGITINTARTHVQRVLAKLGVNNRFQAAQFIHVGSGAGSRVRSA